DVVYGVRSSRKTDSAFKRITAQGFYKFMKLLGVDIVYNHADYRLMSKRALDALEEFTEANLFLRGIVPLVGFKWDIVEYERHERFAGKSKYPLKKMLAFAFDGITSFSVRPIRLITGCGFLIFLASLISLVVLLIMKLAGQTVQGWTTLMASIWLIGGIQLLSLGVIGEYIGKIYKETKRRPHYIIETITLH
ncbi:MAG TPA: glycosyltransferase, partial [Ruminococcaceae bacterium]|nr:glycosyltransferase [Oscillospiraceae bacterium]